jgi:hypothetical protein
MEAYPAPGIELPMTSFFLFLRTIINEEREITVKAPREGGDEREKEKN